MNTYFSIPSYKLLTTIRPLTVIILTFNSQSKVKLQKYPTKTLSLTTSTAPCCCSTGHLFFYFRLTLILPRKLLNAGAYHYAKLLSGRPISPPWVNTRPSRIFLEHSPRSRSTTCSSKFVFHAPLAEFSLSVSELFKFSSNQS